MRDFLPILLGSSILLCSCSATPLFIRGEKPAVGVECSLIYAGPFTADRLCRMPAAEPAATDAWNCAGEPPVCRPSSAAPAHPVEVCPAPTADACGSEELRRRIEKAMDSMPAGSSVEEQRRVVTGLALDCAAGHPAVEVAWAPVVVPLPPGYVPAASLPTVDLHPAKKHKARPVKHRPPSKGGRP